MPSESNGLFVIYGVGATFTLLAAVVMIIRVQEKRHLKRTTAQLAEINTDDIEMLLGLVTREMDGYKRRRILYRVVDIICRFAVPIVPLTSILVSKLTGTKLLPEATFLWWTMGQFIINIALLTPLNILAYETALYKRAMDMLAQRNDVRVIGPLIDALAMPDSRLRGLASDALTRLLPRLQGGSLRTLTSGQRSCLHQQLFTWKVRNQENFVLVILKSLEQLGDATTLLYIQRLLTQTGRSLDGRRISEAGKDCLDCLQKRAEQGWAEYTLLRPASCANEHRHVLVRAMCNSVQGEADKLYDACTR